jgi:excinuclease ABC subunit A
MAEKTIKIVGAKENNLKNVSLEIPRDKLIVFTGVSGSGKTSLAFDTLYAEGQRRYMESLSSYARQFLGQMEKPNVENIEGLSPAISIDQKTTSKNPRSTVGTVTEIYDYFRLLYARIGIPHCPVCGREIKMQTVDQITDAVKKIENGTRIIILAPIAKGKKGTYQKELDSIRKAGFVRVRVDGEIYDLSEDISLEKNIKHSIDIVVDRLKVSDDMSSRFSDSIETALEYGKGVVVIMNADTNEEQMYSQNYACPEHGTTIDELSPRMFSFNNPFGACSECSGLGVLMQIDPELVIPDRNLSIRAGAIRASGWRYSDGSIATMYYEGLAEKYNFSLDTPVKEIPQEAVDAILYGTKGEKLKLKRDFKFGTSDFIHEFEGIVPNLERRYRESSSLWARKDIENYISPVECKSCKGMRLKPEILGVTVGGLNIFELCCLSVNKALEFFDNLKLTEKDAVISKEIIKEIKNRLSFLKNVGLDYLTLARSSSTLSGGESQRIRLATQIGSSLVGVLYILDEPSIGLHQRDNEKLIETLKELRDAGNTVIVVEHDEDTMRSSDYIVDVGKGAGIHGGNIVAAGTPEEIEKCKESLTGQYLSGKKKILVPKKRREGNGKEIIIKGARENNLKNIDVKIPLGKFVCVTGVSGSGKSSLVNEILYKTAAARLNRAKIKYGHHDEILGLEYLDKVIDINQSPIGRTPRSNPATYTGVFTDIRDIFASTQEAKAKGYTSSRFSFNVKGGRCEACQGDGIIKIEMHFLPDVYVPCEVCKGNRYNRETLEIKYKGKDIYDVLEMSVDEGLEFFKSIPRIKNKLQTLYDVGLSYIKIGQPATTLSGGEAQRVKLATELSKRSTGKTLYILDEPTTGLHTADVDKLLQVLNRLVDEGNTVVVIEHNLDVIKTADYIIDLGPEGGDNGGTIVATGTPEEVAKCKKSYTGKFLKKIL